MGFGSPQDSQPFPNPGAGALGFGDPFLKIFKAIYRGHFWSRLRETFQGTT